jgi:hypothetical protein
MTTTVDTTLTAIDDVIGTDTDVTTTTLPRCHSCGGPLSVSDDFCTEDCQIRWLAGRGAAQPSDAGHAPDPDMPEAMPDTPIAAWLGAPPPGSVKRPGNEVLDGVVAFLTRFIRFPNKHCAVVVALWYCHTHVADRLYVTPRLILSSAEAGSGKTRVLEIGQYLVHKPEMTISITTAAIFRLLLEEPVTLLFDEIDAVFTSKGGGNNEDLRGLLNAGYKRTATVSRCVGDAKAMKVQRFPVYAPVALAGIAGRMPNTITTRAITIHMRKASEDEPIEDFMEEDVEREARPIREEMAAWANSVADKVATARPERPDGVRNRAAEIWRPLLALADEAGGDWPAKARAACTHFVVDTAADAELTTGVRLLADLYGLFAERDTDRLASAEILSALCALEESQWADMGDGKPLNARKLAAELARYGVRSVTFDTATGSKARGYVTYETTGGQAQTGLADAWSRYLPAKVRNSRNCRNQAGQEVTDGGTVTDSSVTADSDALPLVTDRSVTSGGMCNRLTSEVTAVTPVTDSNNSTATQGDS